MKKKMISLLLCAVLVLNMGACAGREQTKITGDLESEELLEKIPAVTVPEDGEPDQVTCKGSYTSDEDPDKVVARVADAELTNEELAAWYWAEVAQYRLENHGQAPDFNRPLDTQRCGVDATVNSWQQYFLKQALAAWHTSRAMEAQAAREPIPTEEAYIPNETTHARCMTGMPILPILYGYQKTYAPNSMHQSYLDAVPEMLTELAEQLGYGDAGEMARKEFGASEQTLAEAVQSYNYSYSYLTYLNYDSEIPDQEAETWYDLNRETYEAQGITKESGSCVDIRHVLLVPETDAAQDVAACQEQAQKLLRTWETQTKQTEAGFSEIAYRHSQDPSTSAKGGRYTGLVQGQLTEALDTWCFDWSRKPGDTQILTTEQGVHILYFSGSTPIWQAAAREDLMAALLAGQMESIRAMFPIQVEYASICLPKAEGTVSFEQLLYPDIAHERYPEVPVYLQQDYPRTLYGKHRISSNGCGITTFSMLTTYMSDEEWTPPEMCDLYGRYSFDNGTDGMLFINEPSSFGYFFREREYDYNEAKQALEEGYLVVSIQQKGYWTSGGHYILLERINENGLIQVRDSNIANYFKLSMHKEDGHEWKNIVANSMGFWIFEPKVTAVGACSRCGDPETMSRTVLQQEYTCEKCREALLRRGAWIAE